MNLYQHIVQSSWLPWRLRQGLFQYVETKVYARRPWFYQLLYFGRFTNPLHPVTFGPRHHFFGYYDKTPWNGTGRYLLTHEALFNDRAPGSDDQVAIGVVDLHHECRFERTGQSKAWNWQQGAMLQWHPSDTSRLYTYNDRRGKHCHGILCDLDKGELAIYDRPIYALLDDGKTGFSLNFARLAVHRPGYGYAGLEDPYASDPHPSQDGLWHQDLVTGRSTLLISLAELANLNPHPSMLGAWHYINHIQPSRGGKRIAFFHIWHRDPRQWSVRLYTCRPDGSQLACLLDTGFISHYDWRDDDTLLVWANRPGGSARFQLITHMLDAEQTVPISSVNHAVFGAEVLTEDGHCSFSPDGRWVLNDTYPDQYDKRTLMLIRFKDAHRIDLARLLSPKSRWWGEIRCDLHPRWSPDGKQVCIDSVHEGSRQMYVMDLGNIVK